MTKRFYITVVCFNLLLICPHSLYSDSLFDSMLNQFNSFDHVGLNTSKVQKQTRKVKSVPGPFFESVPENKIKNGELMNKQLKLLSKLSMIQVMSAAIVEVEVGPSNYEALNENPYIPHGLLQPNTEWLRKYHHDTSFGFFGFTHGTLADTIEAAKSPDQVDSRQSYAEANHDRMVKVQEFLQSNSFNVPLPQVMAFYTFYMQKMTILSNSTYSKRSLNKSERGWLDKYGEDFGFSNTGKESSIAFICSFYKVYNGKLDESKIRRLCRSVSRYAKVADQKEIFYD